MSIFTGADIKEDLTLECDVCVVGSGAGGAHVAARLATAGKKVIVLEEGGYRTAEDFNMNEADMYPALYQEGGNRATADLSIAILQGRAVGGTTVVNYTTSFRTPRHVLDYWADIHGVKGITYDVLEPHWQRVEARLGIQKVELGFVNPNNRVLWDGCEKLGWEKSLLARNVRECANTGYCGMGCPVDAKQSMLITLLPEAMDQGADVYANVKVETVEGDGRRITKVQGAVLDPKTEKPTGARVTVKPKITVLAGGGINTPLILLRSGIGNANGRVGKRTFLHPVGGTVGFYGHEINPFYQAPQTVASHQFAKRGEKMGFFIEAAPMHPMLSSGAFAGFGKPHAQYMQRMSHAAAIVSISIDGFDPKDPDEGAAVSIKDGKPSVDYKWTPALVECLREGVHACAQIQLAAGAQELISMHNVPVVVKSQADLARLKAASYERLQHKVFCAHVMGGCAMGGDAKTSVVDSNLRHHEFDNLWVIDGSVFPTSLGVNPQVTIYGMSSWASEHVKAALG